MIMSLLVSGDLGSENLLKISTIYGVAGVIRLLAGIFNSQIVVYIFTSSLLILS